MPHRARHLTTRQWLLLAAFVVVGLGTAAFGTRAIVSAIYWSQHREEPIEAWMTIGYVAHSHRVPPQDLAAALGLPTDERERRPIGEIAAERGVPAAELVAVLGRAVEAHQAERSGAATEAEPP